MTNENTYRNENTTFAKSLLDSPLKNKTVTDMEHHRLQAC